MEYCPNCLYTKTNLTEVCPISTSYFVLQEMNLKLTSPHFYQAVNCGHTRRAWLCVSYTRHRLLHLYRSIVPQFEGQLLAPNSDQGSLRPDPEDGPYKARYGTACCFKLVDVMQISAARYYWHSKNCQWTKWIHTLVLIYIPQGQEIKWLLMARLFLKDRDQTGNVEWNDVFLRSNRNDVFCH